MKMIKNTDMPLKLITLGEALEAALQFFTGKPIGNSEVDIFTNQIKGKFKNDWKSQRWQNK